MRKREASGQALVEFALTIPLFLIFVFSIIQIGLVFIAYYSEAEMALRGSRWLAINSTVTDDAFATHMQSELLPGMVGGTPSTAAGVSGETVATIGQLTVRFTKCTPNGSNCDNRPSGSILYVQAEYNMANWIFLPTTYRLGFYTFTIPTSLPPYKVYKLVE